jgi:mRNA interferase RelE/StbE
MKYTINYKRSASEELIQLPSNIAYKVRSAINSLSENPRPNGCIKLKGSASDYRIRIGNYRVIYTITDTILIVVVIKIANRKDVYR